MGETLVCEETVERAGEFTDLDRLCADTIRFLAADAVQKANSGHPGMPMGCADMAHVLWTRFLRHNPRNPKWPNRDRFVLSNGHGSMLLYSLLHLTGYDLSLDEIKNFRQWGSKTPGHPENHLTPGVETTTGPLGQGFANAVGMALAERWLAERYNRPGHNIVDHYTYGICSDGDLMEGISHEAAALAGHLGLSKLIFLYDDNHITIDGPTSLAFSEEVGKRFAAYGWHVQEVDGHDMASVFTALQAARAETRRPSLIMARTEIGYGSPNRQGTAKAHGEPLGEEEVRLSKRALGWPEDKYFFIPDDVLNFYRQAVNQGKTWERQWEKQLAAYRAAYPELAQEYEDALAGRLEPNWAEALPDFKPDEGAIATRAASGRVINAIAPRVPTLLGGSADLTGSNNTDIKGERDLNREDFSGRYIRFGVREHGMGGILNGMALHGAIYPYGGTFLVFSDYMRPSVRLAALMGVHVIYVFTHDSIGLGEDGPTHQPVEHLAALRAIPNLTVIRPADATETAEAWRVAVEHRDGPVALALTRQKLPILDRSQLAPASGLQRGAYVLRDVDDPQVILIGTGSEVHQALGAAKLLAEDGIRARVVSMPCWELFEKQQQTYRDEVLPPQITARVAVEAAVSLGWERWLGTSGIMVGVNRFGASAPYEIIQREYGITAENVADQARKLV